MPKSILRSLPRINPYAGLSCTFVFGGTLHEYLRFSLSIQVGFQSQNLETRLTHQVGSSVLFTMCSSGFPCHGFGKCISPLIFNCVLLNWSEARRRRAETLSTRSSSVAGSFPGSVRSIVYASDERY